MRIQDTDSQHNNADPRHWKKGLGTSPDLSPLAAAQYSSPSL